MLVQERLSVRRACSLVSLPRSVMMYHKKPKDDSSLIEALHQLVDKYPTIGFWKCYYRLRRKGCNCNHKRLYRIYTLLRQKLQQLIEMRNRPQTIRVDNGPEFISDKLQQWCDDQQIRLQFIQPGKPMQNGFVERNNGSLRKELLDAYLFYSLPEVREMAEAWRQDYNHERPHESLGFVPPVEFN
jgi:integrase-like protein